MCLVISTAILVTDSEWKGKWLIFIAFAAYPYSGIFSRPKKKFTKVVSLFLWELRRKDRQKTNLISTVSAANSAWRVIFVRTSFSWFYAEYRSGIARISCRMRLRACRLKNAGYLTDHQLKMLHRSIFNFSLTFLREKGIQWSFSYISEENTNTSLQKKQTVRWDPNVRCSYNYAEWHSEWNSPWRWTTVRNL